MNQDQERRSNYPMPEEEMYNIKALQDYIEQEKRKDEKERLLEVKSQRNIWLIVVGFSVFMNIVFVLLAIFGDLINGK